MSSRPLARAARQIASRTTTQYAPQQPTIVSRLAPACRRQMHSALSSRTSAGRPRLTGAKRDLAGASQVVLGRRGIFIQTEDTPNPDALKFKPSSRILPDNFPKPYLEYLSPRSTLAAPYPSPLAAKLLAIDGVSSVFFGGDYITITKESGTQWAHVKPEAFSVITEFVTGGQAVVNIVEAKEGGALEGEEGDENGEVDSLAYDENDSEVVSMIKELLETRIRPAIQEDGGDIDFRGFENGQVLLKLRGACRTCDSSTVTLRNGIESMLMHYIEEVKGVEQVFDEEEEVAMREFQKFEERLRAQQGYAPPSTTGKGTLDTVQ